MTEHKHTPGPWHVARQKFREYKGPDDGGWYIAGPLHEFDGDYEPTSFTKRADAALMAAAPDLLRACEMARDLFREQLEILGILRGPSDKETEELETLCAAIAKATGEEPT